MYEIIEGMSSMDAEFQLLNSAVVESNVENSSSFGVEIISEG
jgi:hypothetical protein